MFYEGSKQPVCYNLKEPPLYSFDNQEALRIWNLLASDRMIGEGPSTIRTEAIIEFCRSCGESWETFLKVKAIENVYYSIISKRHSERMEEITRKSKNGNRSKI